VVQALLAAKANVNAGREPALYGASRVGNLEMVRALLAAKPDLDWRDPIVGTTALMLALSSGRWDVARLLVEAGANVNVMTTKGVTALMLVAEESSPRSLAMVQALLAAHADVNGAWIAGGGTARVGPGSPSYARAAGYTALGLAASTGSVEVVQALVANSWVDVNAKQRDGNTPLTIASAKGRSDIVRLLLAAKADVSAADDAGKTALMFASANGRVEVVQALLAAKADVDTRQRDGSTALVLALQNDHPEVARLLTSAGAK
jgi:serine/threonine-protein phosphatase 6 regulatory ankyrin repeat subunit B